MPEEPITHHNLIYPSGTIFFCLLEAGSGMKSDRMLVITYPHTSYEYFCWIQEKRKELEDANAEPFIILTHSATKP